jgi:hypothetical protein
MEAISEVIPTIYLDLNADFKRATEIIYQHTSRRLRVVVHVDSSESAFRLQNALPKKIEDELDKPVMSFTAIPLMVEREEVEALAPDCKHPLIPYKTLKCLSYYGSNQHLGKSIAGDKISAAIEFHGKSDTIIYSHIPSAQ